MRQNDREVLYRKNASAADAVPDPYPYLITTGVILLSGEVLPERENGLTQAAVRRILIAQMNNFRREMVELAVAPAAPGSLPGEGCVRYRAVQVDRYHPESTEPRYRFSHRGLFCATPGASLQLVQLFDTEQFEQAWTPPAARASLHEADAFLRNVRFRQ